MCSFDSDSLKLEERDRSRRLPYNLSSPLLPKELKKDLSLFLVSNKKVIHITIDIQKHLCKMVQSF